MLTPLLLKGLIMKMKKVFTILLLILTFLPMLLSCGRQQDSIQNIEECVDAEIVSDFDTISYATVVAVGDIMVHRWQMQRAFKEVDSTFDFSHSFKYVKPVIESADFAVGNLETTFAGKNKGRTNAVYGYSCFPFFNAPEAMAVTLKEAGFDLFSTANNHSLDAKIAGLRNTLDVLDSVGIYHVGTYRTMEEQDSMVVVDVNGIKIGWVGCTNSLNGNSLKESDSYSVDEFRKNDSLKIAVLANKIRRLKEKGADVVFTIVHFGNEYQRKPNKKQKEVVCAFAEAGADVILGSHPHILQEMDVLTVGCEGKSKKTLVAYSMGNFISSQIQRDSVLKDVGAILKITLKKEKGKVSVVQFSALPTYSYWTSKEIGIVPLIKAYHDLKKFPFLTYRGKRDVKKSYQQTLDVLTRFADGQYEIDSFSGFLNFSIKEPLLLSAE